MLMSLLRHLVINAISPSPAILLHLPEFNDTLQSRGVIFWSSVSLRGDKKFLTFSSVERGQAVTCVMSGPGRLRMSRRCAGRLLQPHLLLLIVFSARLVWI